MKKVVALLFSLCLALSSFGSFAAAKNITFPKEGLPKEVVCAEDNQVSFCSEYEEILIQKLTAEESKDSTYAKFSASQKKNLYFISINSGDGYGAFDFHYFKYTGKNGVFNIYDDNAKVLKNATLTISKDGKTITVKKPSYEDPKVILKTVYKSL